MAKATKGKKSKGKVQKVVTIIKAKGQPDEVRVQRQPEQPAPEQYAKPKPVKLPKSNIRITPKMPKLR